MSIITLTESTEVITQDITVTGAVSGDTLVSPVHPTSDQGVTVIVVPADFDLTFGTNAETVFGLPPLNSTDDFDLTNLPFIFDSVAKTWSVNAASIVVQDPDGNIRDVEPVHIEWVDNDRNAGVDINPSVFKSTNNCSPAFFGTTLSFDRGYQSSSIDFFELTDTSSPQFYDSKLIFGENESRTVNNAWNFRWACPNMLIKGLDVVVTRTIGSAMELQVPINLAPEGLRIFTPNFGSWNSRSVIVAIQGEASLNADNDNWKYVFDGAQFAGLSIFDNTLLNNNRGAFFISSLGSGIPFGGSKTATISEAQTAAALSSSVEMPMILKFKELGFGNQNFTNKLDAGTVGAGKRYRLTFDEAGYTLRVRRTKLEEYDHFGKKGVGGADGKNAVVFQGESKKSNGLLLSYTGQTAVDTTETLGTATDGVVNKPSEFNFINDSVSSASDVEIAYEGLDVTVTGTEVDLILPYMYSPGDRDIANVEVWMSDYEVFAQKDSKSGAFLLSKPFSPNTIDTATMTEIGEPSTKAVSVSLADDSLFSTTRDLSTSGDGITSIQHFYDAAKTYLRVRESETAYDTSRTQSDTNNVFTVHDHHIDFGSRDIVAVTTGRVFTISGDTITIKVDDTADTFGGNVGGEHEAIATTGDINLSNIILNSADLEASNFTNLPTTFPTEVSLNGDTTFTASTTVNAGTFAGTWTYNSSSDGTIVIDGADTDGLTLTTSGTGKLGVTVLNGVDGSIPTLTGSATFDVEIIVNITGTTDFSDVRMTIFNKTQANSSTRGPEDGETDAAASQQIKFGSFEDLITVIVSKPRHGFGIIKTDSNGIGTSRPTFNVTLTDNTAQTPVESISGLTATSSFSAQVITVLIGGASTQISSTKTNNLFESIKDQVGYVAYLEEHEVDFITHSSVTRTNLPTDTTFLLDKSVAESSPQKLDGVVDRDGNVINTDRIVNIVGTETSGGAAINIDSIAINLADAPGVGEIVTAGRLANTLDGIATSDDVTSDGNKTRNFIVGV